MFHTGSFGKHPEENSIMQDISYSSKDEYKLAARIYDTLLGPALRGVRRSGIRMFPPKPGMKVLDVGCGTGAHLEMYRQYGCRLYGLDTSPSMLAIAGKRPEMEADLRIHTAAGMPFENSTFDMVLCMFVLHEMNPSTREATLLEMKRVTRPGGRILLIDFNAERPGTLRGWFARLLIIIAETAAGRRHFRNYRQFMSSNGLEALVQSSSLLKERQNLAAGGSIVLYLLHPSE